MRNRWLNELSWAAMPVSDGFRTFILEQLEQTTRDIRAKSMFGGVGIYAGESFFALIANDTLYFKVDDLTRPKYVKKRMKPFKPYPGQSETMQYYQVPAELIEDADALKPWVAGAIGAAQRANSRKKSKNVKDRFS